MVLFVNACVREDSRTKRLAERVLSAKAQPISEVCLSEIDFPTVDEDFLALRDQLIQDKAWEHPLFSLARQFAQADEIVIAAPFWDLSFPATLKQYLEQINVLGVTFEWTMGVPKGLCKARALTYVTTAGGEYFPQEYGFGYVKALAQNFYGIEDVRLFKAVGLDMQDRDAEVILRQALAEIDEANA